MTAPYPLAQPKSARAYIHCLLPAFACQCAFNRARLEGKALLSSAMCRPGSAVLPLASRVFLKIPAYYVVFSSRPAHTPAASRVGVQDGESTRPICCVITTCAKHEPEVTAVGCPPFPYHSGGTAGHCEPLSLGMKLMGLLVKAFKLAGAFPACGGGGVRCGTI